jgi:hypothetical protein
MVHNSAPVELGEWERAENESMGQVEVTPQVKEMEESTDHQVTHPPRPLGKRIALSSWPPLGFVHALRFVHALTEMTMIHPVGKCLSEMVFP